MLLCIKYLFHNTAFRYIRNSCPRVRRNSVRFARSAGKVPRKCTESFSLKRQPNPSKKTLRGPGWFKKTQLVELCVQVLISLKKDVSRPRWCRKRKNITWHDLHLSKKSFRAVYMPGGAERPRHTGDIIITRSCRVTIDAGICPRHPANAAIQLEHVQT